MAKDVAASRYIRPVVWAVVALDVALTLAVVVERQPAGQLAASVGFGVVIAVVVEASFLVVGAVLVLRRPGNVVSWIMLAVATTWPLWSVAFAQWPGGWIPPIMLMGVQLLLRFPDGRLPTPRWHWFSTTSWILMVVLTVVASVSSATDNSGMVNPHYLPWTAPLAALLILVPISILVSAAALVRRYRRAGPLQREQIRWLVWAGSVVAVLYAVVLVASMVVDTGAVANPEDTVQRVLAVLQAVTLTSFTLVPISVGMAVLRNHLYEIDRVISRTASYAIVTGLLVGTFTVVVLAVGRLAPDGSSLAVAAATLTAAGLARPLLRRVQRSVDHRFNRTGYDAIRTVDAFGNRLREEVDTDQIRADLFTVVNVALQPEAVAIWLREQT